MKRNYLTYPLVHGFVNDWLALGPCDTPAAMQPEPGEPERAFRQRLLNAGDGDRAEFRAPNEIDRHNCGNETLFWTVVHCESDHMLDWSGQLPNYTHRQAWAYVNLASKTAQTATFNLSAACPVSLWLNGKLVAHCGVGDALAESSDQSMRTYTLTADLKTRNNEVLIRAEQAAIGPAALAVALRVDGIPEKTVQVKVPTLTQEIEYRHKLQRALDMAYLDRAVATSEDKPNVVFPHETPLEASIVLRVQTPTGWIYGEAFGQAGPDAETPGIYGMSSPNGPMQAMIMPPHQSYYELNMRAERKLPYWVANRPYTGAPQAAYDERLVEAVREASRRETIFGELAQLGGGWWGLLDPKRIHTALVRVNGHAAGSLADLLGLIAMRQRFVKDERFPADLLPEIDACILGCKYVDDAEPRGDGAGGEDPYRQVNEILRYTCRILAGQTFPRNRFVASGLTGRQERARGEEQAAAWLRQHCATGFSVWNSHSDLLVAALAHLADLAKNDQVGELAAVLLDKVLFGIAVHSFHGIFGGSRGYAEPDVLRSGRFAAESGIGRLVWGMGSYNGTLEGVTSLALTNGNYAPPPIIEAIAADVETEVWALERHKADGPAGEINTATYRTADYMLSSAQDYRPGQRGHYEHIWQATMSPEALVFTNHPTSFSESESREAGWWRGNGSLPRVAQWKDALIALYALPDDTWLKFTHAYFPLYAFDEHVLEEGWAFGRVGDAYVGLFASQGFELMTRGRDAHRELRSVSPHNVWLCQMGNRGTDSSFESFRRRVIAAQPQIDDLHVSWKTLRGDELVFDWTGPLLLNDEEQPLAGFKHHESIYGVAEYPAETMDIVYGADVMRLHFA